jgi:5'-methylthioadenosine phosphorylase
LHRPSEFSFSIGIIGGSGFEDLISGDGYEGKWKKRGGIQIFSGKCTNGKKIVFLPRHGPNHERLPHELDHARNIAALKAEGVKMILASTAVGSMNRWMRPGDLVLLDQFIDFSKSHHTTISKRIRHIDMTNPFCEELRGIILDSAKSMRLRVHPKGTYVCVSGPRYETKAEITAFRRLGGDVVGMTVAPEAIIAREEGLCYAPLATVTNLAAGISTGLLSHDEVVSIMAQNKEKVKRLFKEVINRIPVGWNCGYCRGSEGKQ